MKENNTIRQLSFSKEHIDAKFIEKVDNYFVSGYTIVINPGMKDAIIKTTPGKYIPPLSSTILRDVTIKSADVLILIRVFNDRNIGSIIFEDGWELYSDTLEEESGNTQKHTSSFPKDTPLWRSSQDELCVMEFDPQKLLGQQGTSKNLKKFIIKVNLWFATSKTDCFIHNQHNFIEVHTQIFGNGRMQKFKEQRQSELYEDILMRPGYTTSIPFCNISSNNSFVYPWHQYFADDDCIWLAIEYHPLV